MWISIITMAFTLINSSTINAQEEPQNKPTAGFPSVDFIQGLDKDGDGKLAKSEFPGFESVWDILDNNKDGFIDIDDISSSVKITGSREIIFVRMFDKDDDGKIAKAEFPSSEEDWDFLDADKDGFISIDEAKEGQSIQIIQFFVPTEGNQ